MSRFADTSNFLALLIPNDENHAAAVRLATEWRGLLVTTDFVLIEVGNHLSPPQSRGVELYGSRGDKGWSLTDCISFEIMRDQGLSDALTADRHFVQANFNILMK